MKDHSKRSWHTRKAREQGAQFYYAGNEVWLADEVPADCCSLLEKALNP